MNNLGRKRPMMRFMFRRFILRGSVFAPESLRSSVKAINRVV